MAISLKRTLIAVGVGLQVAVVVEVVVGLPETGNVAVAALQGPLAEVAEQLPGTFTFAAPHEGGIADLRALKAVRNAA